MSDQELWESCVNSRDALKWTEWEQDFLEDLKDLKFSALSPKQREVAVGLINKMDDLT